MNEKFRNRVNNTILRMKERDEIRLKRQDISGKNIQIPVRDGWVEALFYENKTSVDSPILFEVHGGGFMLNGAKDDDGLCEYLHQKLGMSVLSIDYRKSPEYQYPIGLHDVYDVAKYVAMNPEFHVDPKRIAIIGHSAGANLVTVACRLAKKETDFQFKLQILDYPYLDVQKKSAQREKIPMSVSGKLMDIFAEYYTDEEESKKDSFISPVFSTIEELKGMPETYILTCGSDNLNTDGKLYAKLLQEAGVKVSEYFEPKGVHGYIENVFNIQYVPFFTRMQCDSYQKKIAYEQVNRIAEWISQRI